MNKDKQNKNNVKNMQKKMDYYIMNVQQNQVKIYKKCFYKL